MTEAEWVKSRNPDKMLRLLCGPPRTPQPSFFDALLGLVGIHSTPLPRPTPNARKLRLFACACCRRVPSLMAEEASRRAVEISEWFADGEASRAELARARRAVGSHSVAAHRAAWENAPAGARLAAQAAARLLGGALLDPEPGEWLPPSVRGSLDTATQPQLYTQARRQQAVLLRDIFGNPFRPMALPVSWPADVTGLSKALYAGEDCAFALHDALLDAGHPELAAHFKEPGQIHPRGCWLVDGILGKQ